MKNAAFLFLIGLICLAGAPPEAAAQCVYGCGCEEGWCGCNSRGNGSKCEAGGTGCVVKACQPGDFALEIAPDGSVLRLAAQEGSSVEEDGYGALAPVELVRWEYVGEGRAVARDCSGMIVARWYDPTVRTALREQTRTLML